MDLKSLRAFKKVCDTGSISKAADALYITQPGLSKSMARLEAECGHQLFERTSKGVTLTPYGCALYARIDQLVAIMDEIESDTLSLQRSRKLKVASTIGVLLYTGMAFTDDFEAAFPEIELFVEEGSDRRVEEWLSSGAVEIGFLAGPVDRARYDAWLFSRHRHVLDVREGDPLAGRPFVEHRDLDGRIVALLSRDYRPYENNVRWLAEAGAVPRQLIEVVEGFTGSQLVASGRAVSITTDYSSQMRDAAGVVSIPFKNPEHSYDVYLVKRRGVPLGPDAEAFRVFALDWIAAHREELFSSPTAVF